MYIVDPQYHNVAEIRVRYSETDKMGIVYNANHLVWFEIARTEFCRGYGISYQEWEAKGVYLPVVEAHCRYRRPAMYDDVINLYCHLPVESLKKHSVIFRYLILRTCDARTDLIAEGWTRHAMTDSSGTLLKRENPLAQWLHATCL